MIHLNSLNACCYNDLIFPFEHISVSSSRSLSHSRSKLFMNSERNCSRLCVNDEKTRESKLIWNKTQRDSQFVCTYSVAVAKNPCYPFIHTIDNNSTHNDMCGVWFFGARLIQKSPRQHRTICLIARLAD